MQQAHPLSAGRITRQRARDLLLHLRDDQRAQGGAARPRLHLGASFYRFAMAGLEPDDRHWTTSDTGWAKAAYGVLFGPWMNGITVFMYNGRFDPQRSNSNC